MRSPVLETKLYAARVRGRSVRRPRLTDRGAYGATRRLLLVSATGGFCKTTALAQWVQEVESDRGATGRDNHTSGAPRDHSSGGPEKPRTRDSGPAVAWLSLDASDNDPRTFCRYLLAAVHAAAPLLAPDQNDADPRAQAGPATADETSVLADL